MLHRLFIQIHLRGIEKLKSYQIDFLKRFFKKILMEFYKKILMEFYKNDFEGI